MNSILQARTSQVQPQPNNTMLTQFQQFKNSFKGDPKQAVMNMLRSGQITNPQLQQAMQMANQLRGVLK